ncbi:uncharacterized protein L203_100699 [Cryptococcus depauperatus CBS 7841]|uniref:AMP-activated protein kinase glycogen-binding domain-containing protein n=1 Tax=Cryptococcus depauperatus CBS 7841 TaxID=1295531 RepID=A0AAJ8JNN4_9TREE
MTKQHLLTLTWGVGAQTVCVAGGFNDWSATATPLHKQPNGSFMAQIPVPYGEKQSFKYVVDGEWKVREDEAKEWDAAGNMNNVYTAPDASADEEAENVSSPKKSSAEPIAGAGAVGIVGTAVASAALAQDTFSRDATNEAPTKETSVPAKDVEDVRHLTGSNQETKPEVLVASAAPGSAGAGNEASGLVLGEPVTRSVETTTKTAFDDEKVEDETSKSSFAGAVTGGGIIGAIAGAVGLGRKPEDEKEDAVIAVPDSINTATATGTGAVSTSQSQPTASTIPYRSKEATDKSGITQDGIPKDTLSPGPIPVAVAVPVEESVTDKTGSVTVIAPDVTPAEIEKVAQKANIGQAPTEEGQGISEKAAEIGAAAIASIGGILGGAAAVVEKATGVDLTHGSPLTVEEAKAEGIDISKAEKIEGATDATTPQDVPPASAVAALDEKVSQLKHTIDDGNNIGGVSDVTLSGGEATKASLPPISSENHPSGLNDKQSNDIPSQTEVAALNHQVVPPPVFTTISDKDPKKDRSLTSNNGADTAGTKPIDSAPGVDAKKARLEEESHPTSMSGEKIENEKTEIKEANKAAAPDTPENNLKEDRHDVTTSASALAGSPVAVGATGATTTHSSRPIGASDNTVSSEPPSTPVKTNGAANPTVSTPVASAVGSGSAANSPAKSRSEIAHAKDKNDKSVKKKRSSFFAKIKHVLSPQKDKSK